MSRRYGDYELTARIGNDGAFQLFRARHRHLDRPVILKILRGPRQNFDASGCCLRELEAADRLDHAGILRVYETGVIAGRPFLAHAHVDGERLAERLARGTVPLRIAWDWMQQIALALQHAHDRGIIHGSLRPEVVWLTRRGKVRLGGFGNPILFENLALDASVSWAGYLAPEQAGGRGTVGRLTDLYGLGALLYAMVTGGPPFHGTTLSETCRLIRNHPVIHPSRLHPGLSEDVDRLCVRYLRKEPTRRAASDRPVDQFLHELRSLQSFRLNSPRSWESWFRRNLRVWRAAALVGIFVVIPWSLDGVRHRRNWETLLDPHTDPMRYEEAALYFSQQAVDRPRSIEYTAARELSRVRLGHLTTPIEFQWKQPSTHWHGVMNLTRILALACQGQTREARDALEQAQATGYAPRSKLEQQLWRECLNALAGGHPH